MDPWSWSLLFSCQTPPAAPLSAFSCHLSLVWVQTETKTVVLVEILVQAGPQALVLSSPGHTDPQTSLATLAQQQKVLLGQSQEPTPLVLVLGLVHILPALDLQLSLGEVSMLLLKLGQTLVEFLGQIQVSALVLVQVVVLVQGQVQMLVLIL